MMKIKKCRTGIVCAMSVCLITLLGTMALYMWEYRRSAFECLSAFCKIMVEDDPAMEQKILGALKQYDGGLGSVGEVNVDGRFLKQYGYRSEEFAGSVPTGLIVISITVMLVTAGGFLFVWWYPDRQKRLRIAELTRYLEQINIGGDVSVLQAEEDAFSHLQDEMYKTVTELYRTREQAVAAKLNYADNLANIAHQLKTPITAALLSLQLLEKGKSSEGCDIDERDKREGRNEGAEREKKEERSEGKKENKKEENNIKVKQHDKVKLNHINRTKKQLKRLQYLEEALLTLSKIDAGVLKLECTEVDVYTVLNLAADNLNALLSQKNVSVSIPERGCVTFWGDMEWTMEALMNLMKNCMEHSTQGGVIHCDYSENLLYAEIRIWDEGTGFAAEDMPYLFERFYRGSALKEKGNTGKVIDKNDTNVGIGLPVARSIFELQNGTITARNLPQGGASFEIRIYSH